MNYEDENLNVAIPFFIVHGNHDDPSGDGQVTVRHNDGWKTDSAGVATVSGDGKQTVFRIPHGLDFPEPDDPRMLRHVKVVAGVTAGSRDAAGAVISVLGLGQALEGDLLALLFGNVLAVFGRL